MFQILTALLSYVQNKKLASCVDSNVPLTGTAPGGLEMPMILWMEERKVAVAGAKEQDNKTTHRANKREGVAATATSGR